MRFLGIDPGTTRIGYGLIEGHREPKLISYGILAITAAGESERLRELSETLEKLLESTMPEVVGVERIFFSKNTKTAMSVAQARGVIIAKLAERGLKIVEWHPSQVKLAVTNYGQSDKRAVAKMVGKILKVQEFEGYDDATDALAIAIATAFNHTSS